MNSQQKPNTLVKEHVLKLMGFFVEAKDNKAKLDDHLQIGEQCAYFDSAHEGITIYELMLNGGKSVQEKPKANLVVGSSSSKGKQKPKGKKKPTKA
ncbi:hypothetical protein J1N35_037772, partial [Gossypium stocksii]